MSVFLQSVLAVFAAVGFYTGCDAVSEHLIRAALRVRRQYFPGLLITFVEIGSGQGQNIAKYMAARQDITYLE